MGQFIVLLSEKASKDIAKHKKSGNKQVEKKIKQILEELKIHPYTGIGQPEQLKHSLHGFWSRRINQKDRMIYSVNENTVIVEVVSAIGHYGDK
jgi:toxin YoeB